MEIANPIYDVVFRYLMEDAKVAKLILSTILDQEVMEIDLLPTERVLSVKSMTVYRLDFCAKIRTPDGDKQVLIELQKAKFSTDIMRFRRYLGEQYQKTFQLNPENSKEESCLPIISIYFLGYRLTNVHLPILHVQREYLDATTGKPVTGKDPFIESLTHDSYVIQIPCLKKSRQSQVEQLLSFFDQTYQAEDRHRLNFDTTGYPKKYHAVLKRLQMAILEPEVRDQMIGEDDILQNFQDLERKIANQDGTIQKQSKELEEQGKELQQKDKALEEQGKELEEQSKELEQKDEIIQKALQELIAQGTPETKARTLLGLS